jgi:hypothetical protein
VIGALVLGCVATPSASFTARESVGGLGMLLVAVFARARFEGAARGAMVATFLLCGALTLESDRSTASQMGPAALALALAAAGIAAAWTLGRVARRLDADDAADGGVRLVVALQRHPWRVSIAAAVAIGFLAAVSTGWLPHLAGFHVFDADLESEVVLPWLQATVVAISFVAQIGRGARDPLQRFAPWLAMNVLAVGAALAMAQSPDRLAGPLMLCLALVVWPLVVELFVSARPVARETPLVALGLCVLTVASEAAAATDRLPILFLFTLAILPLAFQTLARTNIDGRPIFVGGLAAGALVAAAALTSTVPSWRRHAPVPWAYAAVWPFAAVLVLAARRARSMTAIPRDHPVVADFGARV